ncbi:MAG TPA: CDP-alcohol phosphatidyltransferase, partial [Rhodospirillaceae bacterium]|nr:CDP-alcohol phosphatidyltransferase [Rhodospirillaceae bacterium]
MPRLTNLPNIISITRLLLVPLAVWLIVSGLYPAAFWLFMIAGVSDAVDGFFARLFDAQTPLGS